MSIGVIELLRVIRLNAGLSLRELSKRSGISKTYLIDMEKYPHKCNPTINKIFILEEALNVEYGTVYLYLIECRKNKPDNALD